MGTLGLLFLCSLLPTAAEPVTIHVVAWQPTSAGADKALRLLCTRFSALNPTVTCTIMRQPIDDAYRLMHYWARTDVWRPEVLFVSELWLAEFSKSLAPLPEKAAATVRAHAPASLVARLKAAGADVSVPWWIEPRVLFYWPHLIGGRDWQPDSWDEVIKRAAETTCKRKVWGLGLPGSGPAAAQLFLEMLWSMGGVLRDPDGRTNLSAPSAEEVLSLILRADATQACQPQLLTWSQAELEAAFADCKLAALVAGALLAHDLGSPADKKYGIARIPSRKPFMSVSVDCLVSLQGAGHPEVVARFLEFAASREGQAQIAEAGGLSFYPDLLALAVKDTALAVILEGREDIRGLPIEEWGALVKGLDQALYQALSGRRTVARALEEAQATFREALSDSF